MGVIEVISWIGIIHLLFLVVSLSFTKNGLKKDGKIYLILLLIIIGLHCIDSILTYTQKFYHFPHFFGIKDPFLFAYGPLIFLVINRFLNPNKEFRAINLLHFIPTAIMLVRLLPLYLLSTETKLLILDNMYNSYSMVRDIEINLIINLHVLIYIILSIIQYYQKRKADKINRFTSENFTRIIGVFLLFISIIFFINIMRFVVAYNDSTSVLFPLAMAICLMYLAYNSISRTQSSILKLNKTLSQEKFIKSKELLHQFISLMKNDRLYLNADLDLQEIALKLNSNRQYVSEVINQGTKKSFKENLNEFRVKHAMDMLISGDSKNYTLKKISDDSGFNSLSTFNRAFKKVSGKTPSQFLNDL